MLKMLMNPMGGIVMTNDGNAILREITVEHPAAKSMLEIARTQDEETGDGTTSVIILAGETLAVAAPFLEQQIHPTVIISAFRQALEDMLNFMETKRCITVDINNEAEMIKIIKSCIGTKYINKWSDLACKIAINAVKMVTLEENGHKEIDIKRYAKVEKIPGGSVEDSTVLDGVMFNKDVVHQQMRRRIENPRILILDCNLEYKKGESQTNIELVTDQDYTRILEMEEEYIEQICADIIRHKPDLVITEKGCSDFAQHHLVNANVSVIRRLRKTDCLRIARACGATIVNRTEEIKEEDIGKGAGLFEVKCIGEEYFTYITKCKDPKACTIVLRGASKDVLAEVERNLQDAMNVARNVAYEQKLVPGGGAIEMALATLLLEKSRSMTTVHQWPYRAMAQALEVIPRTLAQNCGSNIIRTMTVLRAKHAEDPNTNWCLGVDGDTGRLVDMKEFGVWDPFTVKAQVYKTAVETAILLLRIDDIVSGTKKQMGDQNNNAAMGGDE
jgi:T-complex protein 1 subunit gamma